MYMSEPEQFHGTAGNDSSPEAQNEEQAWRENAGGLVDWAQRFLVNRSDAHGAYRPLEQRTDDKAAFTAHSPVTSEQLKQHFESGRSSNRANLVGLHSTSRENKCRWLVLDFDNHDRKPGLNEANKQAAQKLFARLRGMGLQPLLVSSGSKGGYHIWLVFGQPVDSKAVYGLAKKLVANWRKLGLASEPETFPKQAELKPGEYGNFVRLPGIHHTRPTFSKVYDGEKWLKGQEAIDHLVNTTPNDFPTEPQTDPAEKLEASTARFEKMLATVRRHTKGALLPKANQEILARFLAKLPRASPSPDGWTACCPVHKDLNPSLSVSLGQRVFVVAHCFSSLDCTFKKICEATGMEPHELTAMPEGTAAPTHMHGKPALAATTANPDFKRLAEHFRSQITGSILAELAEQLGVTVASLQAIGVGWDTELECWTFPERNGNGEVCGIVNRFKSGEKRATPGSKRGLTIPTSWEPSSGVLHICEGASDAAAVLSQGKKAVAIPSKSFRGDDLRILLSNRPGITVAVVADNDRADLNHTGARHFAQTLKADLGCPVKLIKLSREFKDVREYHMVNSAH
jgi:hypothetical protein